ncbi:MAG: hypothetical protein HOQ47_05225 [Streptomyces sp.]|nr:hypothetical protein [Streptomyces sp.]
MSYTNPWVLLEFPELGDDVSVLLKNPQLMPPDSLTPEDIPLDDKGEPVNPKDAQNETYKIIARLIVSWKVYEAFDPDEALDIDPDDDPAEVFALLGAGTQKRFGKVTPEAVGRLPMAILGRLMEEIGRVTNPQ